MPKRLLRAIMLAFAMLALFSGVVLASWEYLFPTTVASTANTSRTYYPVLLGFGGQSFVDAAKISTNGTDTSMQISGTGIQYMMSTANITAVIPSLPVGGVATLDFYTGYSPEQTGFPIITGSGGNVTALDNANIELGGLFAIDMYGYFNTTAGANKNIVLKPNAFSAFVSPTVSGNITVSIAGGGSVTATGVASGVHSLYIMGDNTTMFLYIDEVLEDSVVMGVTVNNSVDNWVFFQGDSMSYVDYFKIWRGSR